MVSHLQFANDTLIMCKTSEAQVLYLHCVIHCFEAVSSLKDEPIKKQDLRGRQCRKFGPFGSMFGMLCGLPSNHLPRAPSRGFS